MCRKNKNDGELPTFIRRSRSGVCTPRTPLVALDTIFWWILPYFLSFSMKYGWNYLLVHCNNFYSVVSH